MSSTITVVLNAASEQLSEVSIQSDCGSLSCYHTARLTGRCGDFIFDGDSRTALPDIAANSSLRVDLTLDCPKAGIYTIAWIINYRTTKYGPSLIDGERIVEFREPFLVETRFFDANWQAISFNQTRVGDVLVKSRPVIVNGSVIYIETMLQNNVCFPIVIHSIEPTFDATLPRDFPFDLCDGEQFAFIGTDDGISPQSLTIIYSIDEKETSRFSFTYDALGVVRRNVKAVLNSPGTVVIHVPFVAQLSLENTIDDLVIVHIECTLARGFLTDGPGKRKIPFFGKQHRSLDFTFMALSTGSTSLPTIAIAEQTFPGTLEHTQTIQLPVIVVHH
jgi:hypothetical protein